MSVVKIHVLTIAGDRGAELEERFTACRASTRMVDVPGFEGVELLRPMAGQGHYFLLTRWDDDAAFCDWLAYGREQAHGTTYQTMTTGSVDLWEFEVVAPRTSKI
ncbi:antibiotic biosynthesis monooxygenase family protein [Pseudonocardia sp. ICBG162]|uniref:antibiotic biosynthesis monooxygenase family protein n=1 Tax=Pseudonocardia sp. ICBG162 TaxID=2846761 RepID=UPI001CF66E29|nr:antibiotic biosynthesis monooxygenase family protein [Pseudonocardia sp. ICBG162]